jgi:hypothetical protein
MVDKNQSFLSDVMRVLTLPSHAKLVLNGRRKDDESLQPESMVRHPYHSAPGPVFIWDPSIQHHVIANCGIQECFHSNLPQAHYLDKNK